MDIDRFDGLTRTVSTLLSRRAIAGALGLGTLALPGLADAKKKHKKKKKIKKNQFGCVNVGGFCKNGGQCCSGICQGKKDKKKCKAHDAQGCESNEDSCLGVPFPCTTSAGVPGECLVTTGNAGYCFGGAGQCFDCTKDADCVAVCGPQAACVVCATCIGESEDATACAGPAADSCVFPAP
jgi:hypothetical protein